MTIAELASDSCTAGLRLPFRFAMIATSVTWDSSRQRVVAGRATAKTRGVPSSTRKVYHHDASEEQLPARGEQERVFSPPSPAVREAASCSWPTQSARIRAGGALVQVGLSDGGEQGRDCYGLNLQTRCITTGVARDGVVQMGARRYRRALATTCLPTTTTPSKYLSAARYTPIISWLLTSTPAISASASLLSPSVSLPNAFAAS